MSTMRLELLGKVELLDEYEVKQKLPTRKIQSLLALLVVRADSPQDRTALALELWPYSELATARQNLRNALAVLRKFLQLNCLVVSTSAVVLSSSKISWEGSSGISVDSYRGDFMPGFVDEWIERYRAEIRQEVVERGLEAALNAWSRDDKGEALRIVRRCCEIDKLNLKAARMQVEFLQETGNPTEATMAAREFGRSVIRELGVIANIRPESQGSPINPLVTTAEWISQRNPQEAMEFLLATSLHWHCMEPALAISVHNDTLARAERDSADRRRVEAQRLYLLWIIGELGPHLAEAKQALERAIQEDDGACAMYLRYALAYGSLSSGDFQAAARFAHDEHSTSLSARVPMRIAQAEVLNAIVHQHIGRPRSSSAHLIRAISLYDSYGSVHENASFSQMLASIDHQAGKIEKAFERLASSRTYFEMSGERRSVLWARFGESQLLETTEDYTRAQETLNEIRQSGIGIAGQSLIAMTDDRLAILNCKLGEMDTSALALARASVLRRKLGTVMSVYERKTSEPTRAILRARLQRRDIESAFKTAREELSHQLQFENLTKNHLANRSKEESVPAS